MRSISELIEPDRVHRTVYTDQEIFDREIEQIFEKVWVYCGHESQVKAPGDSKYQYDYYKQLATIPAEQAYRPLSESACPLVKKG